MKARSFMDADLDIPLEIGELAKRARDDLGINVSTWTLHRLIREGVLAATKVGRWRSTKRALLRALTPRVR